MAIHLRCATPEFGVTKERAGEIAFCGMIVQHLDKNKKKVTCKRCLKRYQSVVKALKRL